MKKMILLCLVPAATAALIAAPVSKGNAKTPAKKTAAKVTAPAKTAAPAKAVPQKPAVPEKKQPYELWMTAHTKALECIDKKQYEEALKLFDQADREARRGSWKNYTLYEKALLLVKMKRFSEALALLNQKVTRDRNTLYHRARTALMRGEIHVELAQYEKAAAEFKNALSSGLNNWVSADALLGMGRICEKKKDFAGASKIYQSLLKDTNRLPGIRAKALMTEVKMLQAQKKYAQALACLDAGKNIEQLPTDCQVELAFLRSDLQIALKDLKGARSSLDLTMRIPGKPAPYLAAIYTRMARISYSTQRYHEAQNLMRRARSVRGHAWGYDLQFHRQTDRTVAKVNRERAIRERRARLERERRARLERQRKARLERERKARLEQERKARQAQQKNTENK